MNTPRFRVALVLPLLLVFAQQSAMLHELSHIHRAASEQLRYEDSLLGGKICEICMAFAQVGNPAFAAIAILPAVAAVRHYAPEPIYSIIAAEPPAPRSRGPPRV
ncbi:MAG TPA: hypothetical protein VK820_08530 [Steroidobacteraceae bacterium]|jgi:hypothetical protein|nr:hypothetical protein [Steroidobacteraceae bacterium]